MKRKVFGRQPDIYYQYLLEYSTDGKTWKTLADKTQNKTDVPHDYIELAKPVKARYIKLTNYHMADGTFALAGLRVFGNGGGIAPSEVKTFSNETFGNRPLCGGFELAKNSTGSCGVQHPLRNQQR